MVFPVPYPTHAENVRFVRRIVKFGIFHEDTKVSRGYAMKQKLKNHFRIGKMTAKCWRKLRLGQGATRRDNALFFYNYRGDTRWLFRELLTRIDAAWISQGLPTKTFVNNCFNDFLTEIYAHFGVTTDEVPRPVCI